LIDRTNDLRRLASGSLHVIATSGLAAIHSAHASHARNIRHQCLPPAVRKALQLADEKQAAALGRHVTSLTLICQLRIVQSSRSTF
jgi:hypothetical protein